MRGLFNATASTYNRDMSAHNDNPQPGDIDTRLQFLLQSSRSLHSSMQELHAIVNTLAATSERHERDNKRFNRVMGAALQAYLSGDTGEGQ